MDDRDLLRAAQEARLRAYAPYSGFKVGAALLSRSGRLYLGCNIENAAFTPTNCAERTAFFKAVSEGEREFEKIAVAGGKRGDSSPCMCAPCGVCRQVMAEFCDADAFRIILSDGEGGCEAFTLRELLPYAFQSSLLNE